MDLVCMIQVIAHFIDPNIVIARCKKDFLSINGYVLIETWNYRSLTAKMLRTKWHEYSPPSVLHWFSKSGLNKLMKKHGFKEIASGRPQKNISVKHAKSLLKHKAKNNITAKVCYYYISKIPDSMKLKYPGDDLLWVLYRSKQKEL
jgi:hypothetical protein